MPALGQEDLSESWQDERRQVGLSSGTAYGSIASDLDGETVI